MAFTRSAFAALLVATTLPFATSANTATAPLRQVNWSFNGPLGSFDEPSIQRGFQIYKEVCSACHGLKRVAFRQLQDVGFGEEEVKSLAAGYMVKDGPNDLGEMFERAGRASDRFPSPYANDNAARAAQNGALPPDLSLIIKARPDGANYVYSLLTGYGAAPDEHTVVPDGSYYNPYFAGGIIKMPAPLMKDSVTYQDGTQATLDQEARDIVNFLQWAAEPEMEERKHMGVKVMIFLSFLTLLFGLVKRRVWSDIAH